MAKQILDYFVSAPASSNGSLSRVVPASPANIKLAEFGLSIPDPTNIVELTATVGWTATLGNPVLLFKILRGSQIIFSTLDETDINISNIKTQSFNAVNSNVPAGQQVYSLTVELVENPVILSSATVTGPVTFTGIAIGDA